MAVAESTPPATPLPKNVKLLAQTLIQSGAIKQAALGCLRYPTVTDTVLVSESHIFLAAKCDATERQLRIIHKQPVHGIVLDMKVLHVSARQSYSNKVQQAYFASVCTLFQSHI